MARRPVFGVETEYAVTAVTDDGEHVTAVAVACELLDVARRLLPYAAGLTQSGIFLASGARFYIDCGAHPEFCTPEVSTPEDAVAHVAAGERILAMLAEEIGRRKGWRVTILRENVDYCGNTFGRHESYLHTTRSGILEDQLLPHLVSRVIFGAGGFDPESAGLAFTLSPRSAYFMHEVAERSTSNRGILHRKSESLAGAEYRRFHVIFPGETLLSETGIYLNLATTALLVAMIDAGERPGDPVRLAEPVAAMHAFAADPSCRAEARLQRGGAASAVAIERHYLARVEHAVARGRLPDWAPAVCARWRDVLDRLACGPEAAAGLLDWPTKYVLYGEHLRDRGFDRAALGFWTEIAQTLRAAMRRLDIAALSCEEATGADSPLRADVEALTPLVTRRGESWAMLRRLVDLRQECHALDTRWGELGPCGVWASLDASGSLSHRIVPQESIDAAVRTPPPYGRARVRGDAIREARESGRSIQADWDKLIDRERRRVLDLIDPFVSEAVWAPMRPGPDAPRAVWTALLRAERRAASPERPLPPELCALAEALEIAAADDLVTPSLRRALRLLDRVFPPEHPILAWCLRDLASHLSDFGLVDGTGHLLSRAQAIEKVIAARRDEGPRHPELALACNELAVCLRRLRRPAQAERLLREAVAIEAHALPDDHPRRPHRLNNLASVLLMQERWDEAREVLESSWRLQSGRRDLTSARVLCLRFALACVEGRDGSPFLGQIKMLAAGPQLPTRGNVAETWDLSMVWDALEPYLTATRIALIRRVADSLNDWDFASRLGDDPAWRDAVPESIETASPEAVRAEWG